MEDEIYQDIESERVVCHINARTRPMFKEMLNVIGAQVQVGKNKLNYGDAVYKVDMEEFNSLFNIWVTACCSKGIMTRTLSTNCTKKLEWSQELSDVERAFLSMEVLKEII